MVALVAMQGDIQHNVGKMVRSRRVERQCFIQNFNPWRTISLVAFMNHKAKAVTTAPELGV